VGFNSVADNTGLSSFVYLLLPPKHKKCREIPREFDITAVQNHPRSPILVSMESPYVTSSHFILVINCNFSCICYSCQDIHTWR